MGEIGTLANNPLRHSKKIAITLIALSSRSAIAGGIPSEIAYSLSDAYVLQVEELLHADEVIALARQAEVHYASLFFKILSKCPANVNCEPFVSIQLCQR